MKCMIFAVKIERYCSDSSVFEKEQGNGRSPLEERSCSELD